MRAAEGSGRSRQKTDYGGHRRGGLCLLCSPKIWDTPEGMGGDDDTGADVLLCGNRAGDCGSGGKEVSQGMEQEKKGLFERLLDFWRERTTEKGGGIGFWHRAKAEGDTGAEKSQGILPQEKAEKPSFWAETVQRTEKPSFWEETAQRTAEQKKETEGLLRKEGKQLFLEEKAEGKKEPLLRTEEKSVQEKKTHIPIFAAEIFQEKTEQYREREKRKTIFLRESPLEEKEKRKAVPIVTTERGLAEEEAAEEKEMPQKKPKTEREQEKGEEIDIERLMQEMTKRLWEEREMSGRRLYG